MRAAGKGGIEKEVKRALKFGKNKKQGEKSVYRKAFWEKNERMHRIYENSIAHSDFLW